MSKSSINFRFSPLRIFFSLLLGIVLSGCDEAKPEIENEISTYEETEIYTIIDYISAFSIQELIAKSDMIVLAKMNRTGGIFNSARDAENVKNADPYLFSIGQIYEFEVIDSLKRQLEYKVDEPILVVQTEGYITTTPGSSVSEHDIEAANLRYETIPFELNNEYLLFLRKSITSSGNEPHFTGVAHPWRFLVYQGCVYPETPWEEAKYYFPIQPLDEFLAKIENAPASDSPIPTAGWPLPTLAPTSALCAPYPYGSQSLPLSNTPYP